MVNLSPLIDVRSGKQVRVELINTKPSFFFPWAMAGEAVLLQHAEDGLLKRLQVCCWGNLRIRFRVVFRRYWLRSPDRFQKTGVLSSDLPCILQRRRRRGFVCAGRTQRDSQKEQGNGEKSHDRLGIQQESGSRGMVAVATNPYG